MAKTEKIRAWVAYSAGVRLEPYGLVLTMWYLVRTVKMLDFAARHGIAPQVEHFSMSKANDAIAHIQAGKARYRIVLDADFV